MNKFIDFADKLHRKAQIILRNIWGIVIAIEVIVSVKQKEQMRCMQPLEILEGLIITLELYLKKNEEKNIQKYKQKKIF